MRTPELLSDPVYHDEEAARLYLQEARWPDGVYCPFCGALDDIKPLGGESMGPGWFYCPAIARTSSRCASARSWSARISRCTNGCWPSA